MGGRNVMFVATVLAAIGVVTIGAWWLAADEREGTTRRSTALTPDEAAKTAKHLVDALVQMAEGKGAHVLRCKLATPRQRYWCGNARQLTVANMVAELLQPPDAAHGTTSCVVKTPNGDVWLVDTVGRCLLWYPTDAAGKSR
jgi:hypothetical protein